MKIGAQTRQTDMTRYHLLGPRIKGLDYIRGLYAALRFLPSAGEAWDFVLNPQPLNPHVSSVCVFGSLSESVD